MKKEQQYKYSDKTSKLLMCPLPNVGREICFSLVAKNFKDRLIFPGTDHLATL